MRRLPDEKLRLSPIETGPCQRLALGVQVASQTVMGALMIDRAELDAKLLRWAFPRVRRARRTLFPPLSPQTVRTAPRTPVPALLPSFAVLK